jgi:hypothetical protein
MGAWSLLLGTGIVLVFIGLYTHWSIMLIGALLPFVPVVSELIKRRRRNSRRS